MLSTIYSLGTILLSYSCGSQMKGQPSSGDIFHARSRVRRDYPSEVMDIVSYCKTVVACLASWCRGIPFHHQIMSDDIDDLQDPRYHMSRRAFF